MQSLLSVKAKHSHVSILSAHIGCPEGSTLNFHILALISSRAFFTMTVDNVSLALSPGPLSSRSCCLLGAGASTFNANK